MSLLTKVLKLLTSKDRNIAEIENIQFNITIDIQFNIIIRPVIIMILDVMYPS